MFPVENPHLWFLVLTAPLCFIATWTDLRSMLIKNHTTYSLFLVFAVVGFFILPFSEFGWRLLNGAIAFCVVLILNNLGRLGGGDAKFIAAAMPYIMPSADHLSFTLFLISAGFLSALAVHRLARSIPFMRNLAPDWKSWTHPGFPGGLTLGGTLFFYLLATAWLRAKGLA